MLPARIRSNRLTRRASGALALPRRRIPGEDDALEERVVWILGSPRTGSSWLLRLLVHPLRTARTPAGVVAPPGVKRGDWPGVVPVNESHMFQHLAPFAREWRAAPENGAELSGALSKRGLLDHHPYLFADAFADAWVPKVRELVLARLRAQAEAAAREVPMSDPLIVIKEPQSSGANFVVPLLPQSRLIFLQRDGREVLRSMVALYGPGGRLGHTARAPDAEDEDARHRFVRQQAQRWVGRTRSVQAAYDRHRPERRLLVRYEDLMGDTLPALRRLTRWMGMGRTEAQLEAAIERESARKRPPGTGRRSDEREGARDPGQWELTPAELEMAEEIMGPTLSAIGYPPERKEAHRI